MNWKTYDGMTAKQKEEYSFKFKDKPLVFDASKLVAWTTMFLMTVIHFVMLIYLAITDETFSAFKDQIQLLLQTTSRVILSMTIIIIICLVGYIINIIYKIYNEYNWKKTNKIKMIK